MAKTKTPTFRENYNTLLGLAEVKARPDLVDFINGRIEALDKKSASAKGKTTKAQKENVGIKELLLEVLTTADKGFTCTEIIKADPRMSEFSNQKVSALLKQMIAEGTVENVKEKGKSLFSAVKTDEE